MRLTLITKGQVKGPASDYTNTQPKKFPETYKGFSDGMSYSTSQQKGKIQGEIYGTRNATKFYRTPKRGRCLEIVAIIAEIVMFAEIVAMFRNRGDY